MNDLKIRKNVDNRIIYWEFESQDGTCVETAQALEESGDFLKYLFITEGSIGITVDGKYMTVRNAESLVFINGFQTIGYLTCTKGTRFILVGVHKTVFQDTIFTMVRNTTSIKWDRCIEMFPKTLQENVLTLPEGSWGPILDRVGQLKTAIMREDFRFHKQGVFLSASMLMLEMMDIAIPREDDLPDMHRNMSYKDSLSNHFLAMAMDSHRQHHTLKYYADALNISTQYLTHIIKQTQNVSANKIINNMILLDAKAMLKIPTKSIKQIAFELGFADQSIFGKFFKKNAGITASEYRHNATVDIP